MAKSSKKPISKHSPKAKAVVKTTSTATKKKTLKSIARKTTEKKSQITKKTGTTKKSKTPTQSKKVKVESDEKINTDTESDFNKLDTIILSKSKNQSANNSAENSYEKPKKPVKKSPKEESKQQQDRSGSGDSRSKSPKNTSQESFIKISAKQQISGKVDTQSISDQLSKIMKKIEVKKVQSSKSPTDKPRSRSHKQKITAKSQNFTLNKNPKMKTTPICDLFELSKKSEYNSSEIIMAIMEIGQHHQCYILPDCPKSNSFWEEIIQFNEFKKIFQFYRPETLKKYWRLLSWKDCLVHGIRLVKYHKKFLDEKKPKLLTIIAGIQNFACKKITSFTDFIVNHHKYLTFGLPMDKENEEKGKRKYLEIKKVFKGENYTEEIKSFLGVKTQQSSIYHLEEKDEVKSKFFV